MILIYTSLARLKRYVKCEILNSVENHLQLRMILIRELLRMIVI